MEEEEIKKQISLISESLKKFDAVIEFEKTLEKRKLAYTIKGHTSGEYAIWYFSVIPEKIKEINEKMKHSEFVIRHLILCLSEKSFEKRIKEYKEGIKTSVNRDEENQQENYKKNKSEESIDKKEPTDKIEEQTNDTENKDHKSNESPKSKLEDLDKKLDEILQSDKI
jgi:ribosomal protein S6